MARQRRQRRRAASAASYTPPPPDAGEAGRARKARASASAARSVGARERWRTISSRSPCSPVAASVHLPGMPGGPRRTKSERPLAPSRSARDPIPALPAAVREVAAADLLGALAERGGDIGGGHGVRPVERPAWMGEHGGPLSRWPEDARYRPSRPLGGAGGRGPDGGAASDWTAKKKGRRRSAGPSGGRKRWARSA